MATERQLTYIKDLLEKKDIYGGRLTDQQIKFLESPTALEKIQALTDNKRISNIIDSLLKCPKNDAYHERDENTPNPGYFFIVDPTDNREKFFCVNNDRSQPTPKARLSVQASDFFYPIKNARHRKKVYQQIMKDPINAMNEYGIRLERCGVCNRTLTDRDSRLRGIGPICAARLNSVATDDELALLAQIGLIDAQAAPQPVEATPATNEQLGLQTTVEQLQEQVAIESEIDEQAHQAMENHYKQHDHNKDDGGRWLEQDNNKSTDDDFLGW